MTSPQLPAAVTQHLMEQLTAASRAPLKSAQAAMSEIYRGGGHSREAVPDATAALAYAVARMPATYAACVRAFDLLARRAPQFAPETLLDLGAGPGTAALAAQAVWPGLAAVHLVEPNAALAQMATGVVAASTQLACRIVGEPAAWLQRAPQAAADLVTLSYVLAEQAQRDVADFVRLAAGQARTAIVIVEPGTPAGYARILVARAVLIDAGFAIAAPCPHPSACPLPEGDWCHFSVRLQRSAAHMHLKDAAVPFEDERFSFVAGIKGAGAMGDVARLIRPARIEKGFVDLDLCTAGGLETRRVRRRDKAAYKAAKALDWGDEA